MGTGSSKARSRGGGGGNRSNAKSEEDLKREEAIRYFREHYNPNREPREITSSTYKRAQNRLQSDVENFLGIKPTPKKRRRRR